MNETLAALRRQAMREQLQAAESDARRLAGTTPDETEQMLALGIDPREEAEAARVRSREIKRAMRA